MNGICLTGLGAALPEKIVTNADLEARLDTSDSWISERTGINERHIGGTAGSLGTQAGAAAMADAGVEPDSIDLLILATTTPDQLMPSTSCTIQNELGLSCGSFDLNAACSGFVYSIVSAAGIIALGAKRALVIGSEALSGVTDQEDRNTAILFGDGAGAVVLEATDQESNALLGWDLGADGSTRNLLYTDHGGYIQMDGKEVFRKAVRILEESTLKTLTNAGLTVDDIDLFVPHQANIRIISAAANRLGIPMERVAVNLDRVGNTSSASIPLALNDARSENRLHDGDKVLVAGFGAGMTWASAVLKWGR